MSDRGAANVLDFIMTCDEHRSQYKESTVDKVIQWAKDKGIANYENRFRQYDKLLEEVKELGDEMGEELINDADIESIKLEIGDCMVVLTILCQQYGLNSRDCLKAAYEKIKDRKGKTINGTFVKDANQ